MTENKKQLTDEELNAAAGGNTYSKESEVEFEYPIGYQTQICDCSFPFYSFTHTAVITRRGYYQTSRQWMGCWFKCFMPCYYFDGDSDVAGWYPEDKVAELPDYNYADTDTRGCYKANIILVD